MELKTAWSRRKAFNAGPKPVVFSPIFWLFPFNAIAIYKKKKQDKTNRFCRFEVYLQR